MSHVAQAAARPLWLYGGMTRYADPTACPDCRARLTPGSRQCDACGLVLTGPLGQELFATLTRADVLLAQMRAATAAAAGAPSLDTPPAVPSEGLSILSGAVPMPTASRAPGSGGPGPRRVGIGTAPRILLALGALCLVVAATVFLAVTWSLLGVGGRTAVLVVLTAGTAALTAWAARRGLRGAAEALGLVTAGLVTLDATGARTSGWLGEPSTGTFAVLTGGLLLVGGAAAATTLGRTRIGRFVAGEATAVVGLGLVVVGLSLQSWGSLAGRLLVATAIAGVVTGVLSRAGRRDLLRVAIGGTGVLTAFSWIVLVGAGVDRLGVSPSVRSVWLEAGGWPLAAAALAAAVVVALRPLPEWLRVLACGAGLLPALVALTAPAYDEGGTALVATVVVVTVALSTVVAALGRPWGAAPLGALAASASLLLTAAAVLGAGIAQRYVEVAGSAWRADVGARLGEVPTGALEPWLLPLVALALAALVVAVQVLTGPKSEGPGPLRPRLRSDILAAAVTTTGLVLAGTLVLYPVPVWLALGALLALLSGLGALALARPSVRAAGAAAAVAVLAVPFSLTAPAHTAATLTLVVALAAALHLRSRTLSVVLVAGAALAAGVGGLVWTGGRWAAVEDPWTGLVGLVVVAVVVLGRGRLPVRTGQAPGLAAVELTGALTMLALGIAGTQGAAYAERADWTAVYLTVAGTAASILALLRDDRRAVGWLGGLLLAGATWVRLAEVGVTAPEPYTLPSATALLAVGWLHLRRHPDSSTHRALGAGLGLALVPSLLWVLEDPLTLRALLLGLACLGLVVAGARLQWGALLTAGAAVGALLVLREAGPYGYGIPRWMLIGAAGALLITLGITWEQRVREARTLVGYVRHLR